MAGIDWAAPWFAPWRAAGEPAEAAWRERPLHVALNLQPAPVASAEPMSPAVRFVPQDALPAGTAYEGFVFGTRQVPVREGLHDFFNGLCWHCFPRTKAVLNQLQAEAIARDGVGSRRGPVRDAITVFDENGALLHAPEALWDALLQREWRRAFVDLRPLWAKAQLTIFGHALLEKLQHPRKDLTAHVWRADAPPAELDGWLACQTSAQLLASKPFTPLPVLGVPGWWAGNEAFSFYDDPLVFRPRRA